MGKQKLTILQQVEHMKSRGILFNIVSEEEAAEYLLKNNYYFRLIAYANNYELYKSGQNQGKYRNLEFAYLKELAIIDMLLRGIIFSMTLDIEHYIKVQLINDVTALHSEDGYTLVRDVFCESALDEIENEKLSNSICADLIEKYRQDWAVWNIVEILSFSKTIMLYSRFYEKHPELPNIAKHLYSIRYIRNAVAHNNCLINSLKQSYTSSKIIMNQGVYARLLKTDIIDDKKRLCEIAAKGDYAVTAKRLRKWMDNHVVNDFIVMVVAYCTVVTSKGVRSSRLTELQNFLNTRARKNYKVVPKILCKPVIAR